jgi:OPA family glycerol-3-phosphate transporter-like MFS transporter
MAYLDLAITCIFFLLLLLACSPTSAFKGWARFRLRRERNWFMLGSMYACYYLCRHNLGVANKPICDEFGFSREQFGWIITSAFWAYAVGQCVNGFLADRIGGKRSMLLGALGTIVFNILFGVASFWGLLGAFIAIRTLDGYMQSMGAPGFIKINAAWFSRPERGGFSGVFGFMIQMGQVGIQRYLGPALLTGTFTLGFIELALSEPLHWRYLFWVPSIITAVVAVLLAVVVKSTPEAAGFRETARDDRGKVYYEYVRRPAAAVEEQDGVEPLPVPALKALRIILTHQGIWFCAIAYFCTGFVRYGVLNWYLRFLEDYGVGPKEGLYLGAALAVSLVAIIGSLAAGYISDLAFRGRRAPVAAALYILETAIILAAAGLIGRINARIDDKQVILRTTVAEQDSRKTVEVFDNNGQRLDRVPGMAWATVFMVLVALTCNSTHSIIGAAAPMDIGGRRMSGFASGVIDSFQYIGGGLTGFFVGSVIDDYGYTAWMLSMAPAGIIGSLCMLVYRRYERTHIDEPAH